MTKFILHGGGEGRGDKLHDVFFQEITKNLSDKAKILCVYFAVPDELVKEKHIVYEDYFSRNNSSGKEIELKIATKKDFIKEVQWADAVYFRGGDTNMLLAAVKKYPNFKGEILKKAIVAGSSAGVYLLSEYGLSSRKGIVYKGLGILPIKSACHYKKGMDISKLNGLRGELVLLKEGEYKIIER